MTDFVKEPQNILWKRVFVEAAAIVASILLAFAIDAWWADRQQKNELNDQLAAILVDMQAAEEYMQYYRVYSVARQEAVKTLMVAANSAPDRTAEASLDEMLSQINWAMDTSIMPEGSINSLILSGNLSAIESTVLRNKLSGWPTFLSYLRQNYERG